MRRSSQARALPPAKPPEYDAWIVDLAWIADTEGLELFVMAWMGAPAECCAYLEAQPGELERLIARARWADRCAEVCGRRRVS